MVGAPGLKRLSGIGGTQGPRHTDLSGYKVWNGLVACNVVGHLDPAFNFSYLTWTNSKRYSVVRWTARQ